MGARYFGNNLLETIICTGTVFLGQPELSFSRTLSHIVVCSLTTYQPTYLTLVPPLVMMILMMMIGDDDDDDDR